MRLDKITHQFYELLSDVLWRELPINTSMSEHFLYYYAEDRLYIFKDKGSGAMFFQEGSSPNEAFNLYVEKHSRRESDGNY